MGEEIPMRSENLNRLGVGKIPIGVLDSTVLRFTGAESKLLATPPKAGLDFAAIRLGRNFMVISADPITGVVSEIGRYAVAVSANDVATSGNRPQFLESVVLLPAGSTTRDVAYIARQIHIAAKDIGVTIVGGHTEVTPGLSRPIVITTAFSFVRRYVSSDGARAGDTLMMTKTAGLEGTAALARELGPPNGSISSGVAKRAKLFLDRISVVDEAEAAFETGRVNAMHDCTEGGVLGAAYEMSLASGVGFELDEGAVPVAPETKAMCKHLSLDPMKLIGSGSLLIATKKGSEKLLQRALNGICGVSPIGRFTNKERVLLKTDGSETRISTAPEDELWRALRGRE